MERIDIGPFLGLWLRRLFLWTKHNKVVTNKTGLFKELQTLKFGGCCYWKTFFLCLSLVWVFEGAHTFNFDFKVIYSLLGMKWSFFLILYFPPTFNVLFPIYFVVSFYGLLSNLFQSPNSFVHMYSLLTVYEYFNWTTLLVTPISFI